MAREFRPFDVWCARDDALNAANAAAIATLQRDFGISRITALLLTQRGFTTSETANAFLHPRLGDLHDPFLLPDMMRAVERILTALERRESILIYGDYDVDGTCATALLIRFFRALNVELPFYIPDRNHEGYGMHRAAIETIIARGVTLIITVDTGSTAHDAIAFAKSRGVDVIVTDHHECGDALPPAFACINPKRSDNAYPFRELCGTAVAFKLITALRAKLREHSTLKLATEPNLKQFLDLVALATIADVMPLMHENRILVQFGLRALLATKNAGLAALQSAAGITPENFTARSVAFGLAPRINAAGRMAHANASVELLITDDSARAQQLAQELSALNAQRQTLEHEILQTCDERLRTLTPSLATQQSIVLWDEAWPVGVVGIIAGRLAEHYRVPTILLGVTAEKARGSGRTVGDFPLLDAVRACAEQVEHCGGHHAAIGVTLAPAHLEKFATAFAAACAARLRPTHQARQLAIDAWVTPQELTLPLLDELAGLAPFGVGNPEPVLGMISVILGKKRIVGTNHWKVSVTKARMQLDAIGFSMGNHPASTQDTVDLAFTPQVNSYGGLTTLQLKLCDVRAATI